MTKQWNYTMKDDKGTVVPHKRSLNTTLQRFKYPELPADEWYAVFKSPVGITSYVVCICTRKNGTFEQTPFAWWEMSY
jgi:hypothetical protein